MQYELSIALLWHTEFCVERVCICHSAWYTLSSSNVWHTQSIFIPAARDSIPSRVSLTSLDIERSKPMPSFDDTSHARWVRRPKTIYAHDQERHPNKSHGTLSPAPSRLKYLPFCSYMCMVSLFRTLSLSGDICETRRILRGRYVSRITRHMCVSECRQDPTFVRNQNKIKHMNAFHCGRAVN